MYLGCLEQQAFLLDQTKSFFFLLALISRCLLKLLHLRENKHLQKKKPTLFFSAPYVHLAGAPVDFSCARRPDKLIRGPNTAPQRAGKSTARLVNLGGEEEEEATPEEGAIARQEFRVLVGNRKWIREKNFIEIPADVENRLQAQERLGRTALLMAVDGKRREGSRTGPFGVLTCSSLIYRIPPP